MPWCAQSHPTKVVWAVLASTVVIGGQSLDMMIVQPLHRGDYPAIEKQLVARLMLARMGTALHLPYEDANLIRTLNNLGEAREVASRFREANAYYLEALELTEGTAGGAASNVARSEYRVFINEHPELR